ncbi:dihydroorotase [endosymbiont of Ridgeia piscesae]|jgi:dihydroorotase|uniref:Dihydroorotase n=1 Tax=endosymbiont of Ridgeia piscesae TaxID=54398 RepID=A0A0T5YUK0_9GAMM|nr:dihydroorotase [endosymbiont of Ridgeia piscesae]KRT54248.1 dihydroorotase [endosymbiont of Ridgeia piscesae]KRT57943.1 dihydroorotase [endosymbiont of Ridgeia piscesae]
MKITIHRPDDWHLHLRDDAAMTSVLAHSAKQFARAIIMPNLKLPVANTDTAQAYRQRILSALPEGSCFEPLMTLYMTDNLGPDEVARAKASDFVHAIKLYPAGATTNSDAGVTNIERIYPTLEAMQQHDLPLLIHGEATHPEVDTFDREAVFLDQQLAPLVERFPELRLVLEHITTQEGVEFVKQASGRVAGTITAHHLLYNRTAIFTGGIRPHLYCLPILKRERHRQALVDAATSGDPRFFLGTDSAPHPVHAKECACGCAGCYTAHAAIELYAEAFDRAGALDKLEGFANHFGPDFYGLPRNSDSITLEKSAWDVPTSYAFGSDRVIPLRAGEKIEWRIVND